MRLLLESGVFNQKSTSKCKLGFFEAVSENQSALLFVSYSGLGLRCNKFRFEADFQTISTKIFAQHSKEQPRISS